MVLIERREAVAAHLDVLERVTAGEAPGIRDAIYASIALRFLMDNNALGAVAHDHGIAIKVAAPDFGGTPLDHTFIFAAGGYPYSGALTHTYYLYRGAGQNSHYRAQFERQLATSPAVPPMVSVKLAKFFETPCLGLMGQVLDRRTLVRYVANKCGGAHYSGSRAKFDDIDNRLTDLGQLLQIEGHGLSAVFLETLGTAWLLLQSPEVVQLRRALR